MGIFRHMLWYKAVNVTELFYTTGRRAADLAAAVEGAVRDGRLQPGERLPTVRRVAAELGVSPATVAAAYRELGRRGLAVGAGRSGTSIAPRPPLHAGVGTRPRPGLRDLAQGHPDPRLLPDWSRALAGLPRRSVSYGAPLVEAELADLARERFRADGLDASHLTVVSGAVDGIERVLGAHLRAGDAVAVEDPVYPPIIDLVRAMSLRALPVRVDARGMLADDLEQTLRRGARAVVMTPRSQNPFGSALDDLRRTELRRVLARHPEVAGGRGRPRRGGRRWHRDRGRHPGLAGVGGGPLRLQDPRPRPPPGGRLRRRGDGGPGGGAPGGRVRDGSATSSSGW